MLWYDHLKTFLLYKNQAYNNFVEHITYIPFIYSISQSAYIITANFPAHFPRDLICDFEYWLQFRFEPSRTESWMIVATPH